MRYSLISAFALLTAAFAQDATPFFDEITAPTEGQQVIAGKPFEITWLPGTEAIYLNGTATIVLLQGSTTKDLQVGPLIVAGVKNSLGKYSWNVPADPTFTLYGLRITLDDDKSTTAKEDTIFQYSFPFQITKSAASGTVTVRLGTGTAYTPEPTTTSTKTLTSANSTTITSTFTSASSVSTNSSNVTLATTATRVSVPSTSASSTGAAQVTGNAAVANAVSGGLMMVGGVVLAFAL